MDTENLKQAAKAIRSVVSKQDMSDMSWNSVEGWLSAIERELEVKAVSKKNRKTLFSAADIRVFLAENLPFFEREDKDDFHYLAKAKDIEQVSLKLFELFKRGQP